MSKLPSAYQKPRACDIAKCAADLEKFHSLGKFKETPDFFAGRGEFMKAIEDHYAPAVLYAARGQLNLTEK